MTWPSGSEITTPMMLALTRRWIFDSRSARSRYSRAFSSALAACEASSFSTASRAGRRPRGQVVFEVKYPDELSLVNQRQAEN